MSKNRLIQGDCLEELKKLEDESVDAVITDPPYGLGFMGKEWDELPPGREVFGKCLRVLKPGGHLISFGGTRTYHRMAVAVEDAGFEIRDMLEWVYASGFPKSQNVGAVYDKKMNNEREKVGEKVVKGGENLNILSRDGKNDSNIAKGCGAYGKGAKQINIKVDETKGNSQWEGYGTALKPAHEPIVLARKSLSEKTIVENCIEHGTGALDIDGCRIPANQEEYDIRHYTEEDCFQNKEPKKSNFQVKPQPQGRFPADVVVTDDALNDGEMTKTNPTGENSPSNYKTKSMFGVGYGSRASTYKGNSGSKSRYFDIDVWAEKHGICYFPKASKSERNRGLKETQEPSKRPLGVAYNEHSDVHSEKKKGNTHPTCKPLKLMSWLITLVTKPDDTVLDPFMGSGTTGIAAMELDRNFIGIELEEEYFKIAENRLKELETYSIMQ